MKKIGENSHFQFVNGDNLAIYKNRILQIDTEHPQKNVLGGVLYVCEINDDFGRKSKND